MTEPADGGAPMMLPPDWFKPIVNPGVDLDKPGIYRWCIEGVGSYIGKYTSISRPMSRYTFNLIRLVQGGLPLNGRRFRRVHRELAQAVRDKRQITLTILENVERGEALNSRERALIAEHGSLNDPPFGRRVPK